VDVTGLEYVGAKDLIAPFDGATFFTFQRYSSTQVVIRRWELDTGSLSLRLRDVISKTNIGVYKYDCNAFAVEHWRRTFAADAESVPPHTNEIQINSLNNIASGDILWLGPSTDTDNVGAVEDRVVDTAYTDGIGNHWVRFTTDFTYQYVSGDPITFAKYIYLFTDLHEVDGRGAIYKLDAYSGSNINYAVSNTFRLVTAAAWNDYYNSPTIARDNMLFHIRTAVGYVINRAHDCWLNYEDDHVTLIPMRDLLIDGTEVFKLQEKQTTQDNDGVLTTTTWSEYNYQKDTQSAYSNSLIIWVTAGTLTAESNIVLAGSKIKLACRLIDQRGFPIAGLGVENVTFYSDEVAGEFDPLDGKVETDLDGYAELYYTLGLTANGTIEISGRALGSDAANSGGLYIWCRMNLYALYEFETDDSSDFGLIHQIAEEFSYSTGDPTDPQDIPFGAITQLSDDFTFDTGSGPHPYKHIRQHLKFTNPGGDWVGATMPTSDTTLLRQILALSSDYYIQQWSATSDVADVLGPPPCHPNLDPAYRPADFLGMAIRQLEDFDSEYGLDQLRQAFHESAWLSTDETLNQFIFIVEVVPAWYSIKNPIIQYIYIKISPYAYDLDPNTFVMRVKNTWIRNNVNRSTGWKNVTSDCTITTYGSPIGLEVNYDPAPDTWEYNSRVYVWIQVYDTDPSGANLMDFVYWWDVIDDYRAPTITNQYPAPLSTNVDVDTYIQFDVLDSGLGIDQASIRLTVEGNLAEPLTYSVIANGYRVRYTPAADFFYDQRVELTMEVSDLNDNFAHDSYYFDTGSSSGPWFHGAFPRKCAEGIIIDSKVMLQVYGIDHGINTGTIVVKIDRKTREIEMVPIIYRLS
jgi:hypothetical protein